MSINGTRTQVNPVRLDISRSRFDMPFKHTMSMDAGRVNCAFAYSDVLPGDTFKVDMSFVLRSTTPVGPVMDDMYADIAFFFVPHKLTLSRQMMSPSTNDSNRSWAAFIGAQDSLLNMPLPASGVELPHLIVRGSNSSSSTSYINRLGDQLGYAQPADASGSYKINPLEILAYASVWNAYWRDPNSMSPIVYSIGLDGSLAVSGQTSYGWSGTVFVDNLNALPACRFHGFFGDCLPWPQRNSEAVKLPLGDKAPLQTLAGGNVFSSFNDGIHIFDGQGNPIYGTVGQGSALGLVPEGSSIASLHVDDSTGERSIMTYDRTVRGTNLYADLSSATAATINDIRYAFALQRWYEALARGGNSLSDMTAGMFGVTPHDVNADRPEYLGGKRVPITISQVNATGENVGQTGAFSLTTDKAHYFTKSFDTWGTIICTVVIRTADSFCQGINMRNTRFKREQFYWPQFANLGEQPILKKTMYVDGKTSGSHDEEVFGYQEAWAEYRMLPDIVSGVVKPTLNNNYGYWTYCNHFSSAPTLAAYLNGDSLKTNVDRTLVVPSSTAGFQFLGQFFFDVTAVRPMPTYSVPGLIDHH